MPADCSGAKRALRADLRERRRTMTSAQRADASEGHTRRLIEVATVLGARSVSAYLSSPTEPNTRPFLNWARQHDVRTLLPIAREDGLLDWTTGDGDSETRSILGLPEAVGDLLGPIAVNDVDLIVVPAAAVDRSGMRLGWGRGYFDKTLGSIEKCPPVFALVFEDEVLDEVPSERHDQPVDGAVTPARILRFP